MNNHATLSERVDYVEGLLGDSADKHAKELEALKIAHDKLHNRLGVCEHHGSALNDLHRAHSSLASEKAMLDSDHLALKDRLDNMEGAFGDATNKQTKEMAALKSAHA